MKYLKNSAILTEVEQDRGAKLVCGFDVLAKALICICDAGGCVAKGDTGGAIPLTPPPPVLLGLPVVDNLENAASASGKFGGVAGVLHGVISCCNVKK